MSKEQNNIQFNIQFNAVTGINFDTVKALRLIAYDKHAALATFIESKPGSYKILTYCVDADGHLKIEAEPNFEIDSFFGVPSWDLVKMPMAYGLVWNKPGSAISSLSLLTGKNTSLELTQKYPMGVFQGPRFVAGDNTFSITALFGGDVGNELVVFQNPTAIKNNEYIQLPRLGSGVLAQGLLLKQQEGYLLITKHMSVGKRGPDRADLSGESIPAGKLFSQLLDANLRPVGEVKPIFEKHEIYEYDASVSGDILFLFATTKDGYIYAGAKGTGLSRESFISEGVATEFKIVSPSVSVIDAKVAIAFINPVDDQKNQIVTGEFKL